MGSGGDSDKERTHAPPEWSGHYSASEQISPAEPNLSIFSREAKIWSFLQNLPFYKLLTQSIIKTAVRAILSNISQIMWRFCTYPYKVSSTWLLQKPQGPGGSIPLPHAAITSRPDQATFCLNLFPLPHHPSLIPSGSLTLLLQNFAQSPSQWGLPRPSSLKILTASKMTLLIPLTLLYSPLSTCHLAAYHIAYFFVMLIVFPFLECKLHKGTDLIYRIWAQNLPGTQKMFNKYLLNEWIHSMFKNILAKYSPWISSCKECYCLYIMGGGRF